MHRAAVVAPCRAMIRYLEVTLAKRAERALAGVAFHTFQSLAREILLDAGVPRAAMAEDNLLDSKFLEGLIAHVAAEGPRPAGSPTPGLVSSLLNSVRDLEEAMVDPADFPAEALDKEAPETADLKRLLVLAGALRERRREQGLLGRTDIVVEGGKRAGESRLVKAFEKIFYYGSYDLTQHQLEFLFALGSAAEVTVMVPVPAGEKGGVHPAYRFAEPTVTFISQKAGPVNALAPVWDGALGDFPNRFMAGGAPGPVRDSSRAVFWKARTAREEFDLAGREAWRLISEQGYGPQEIMIVARSLGRRLGEAAAVFESIRLPWTSSAGTPLCDMATGRSLTMLAQSLTGDAGPEAVLEVCAAPWLKAADAPPSMSRAAALCARLPAHAGTGDWDRLSAGDGQRGAADRETLGIVKGAAARLARMAETFPESGTWSQFTDRFLEMLDELTARENLPAGSGAERVYEAFVTAVDGLRRLDASGEAADRARFRRAVEEACRAAQVRLYERGSGVEFLDVMDARGRPARALFLVGMNEDEFPRAMSEDPFLKDAVRRVLNEVAGFKIQQKLKEGLEEERLLFHLAVSSARERLYLSWHTFDDRGRPALPSGFFHDLLSALKPGAEPETVPAPRRPDEAPPRVAPRARAAHAAASAVLAEIEDEAAAAGGRDGFIGERLNWGEGVAVTGLETAAKCPFRAFAGILLGIEPPRRPRSPWEPEPARMGNAVHSVLEAVGREGASQWKPAGAAALAAAAREKLEEVFGGILPELSAFPVLRAALLEELGDLLAALIESDAAFCEERGWVPREFEKRVKGSAGKGLLNLRGKIDRVDRRPGGTRLLDYKTHYGRESLKPKASLTPDFFQLGLYASALEDRTNDVFLGILHVGSGIGGVVPQNADGPVSALLIERARGLAERVAENLSRGAVFPMPDDLAPGRGDWEPGCGTCDFNLVCRKDHAPTLARLEEAGDPAELAAQTRAGADGPAGEDEPAGEAPPTSGPAAPEEEA